MTHLVPATLVRDAVERVALSARPNAPVLQEEDHSPKDPHGFTATRLAFAASLHRMANRLAPSAVPGHGQPITSSPLPRTE
jgi:hypothetical protein